MTSELERTSSQKNTINMEEDRNNYELQLPPVSPSRVDVYSSCLPISPLPPTIQPSNLLPCPTYHISRQVSGTKETISTAMSDN